MDKLTVLNKEDFYKQTPQFFYSSKPKNVLSGGFQGLTNITKGVFSGICGFIGCPIYYSLQEGPKGFAKGLGLGVTLAIALPIGGTVTGLTQFLKGIYNTPEAVSATIKNKIWDRDKKKWIYYSLEQEAKEIADIDESKFINIKKSEHDGKIKEMDYYNILNVNPEATTCEIKKVYYQLAKTTHPDKNPSNSETFKLINEAYQVLGNESLRTKYNQHGKEGIKDVALIDSETFYNLLFGGGELKFYIGEMIIYTLMTVDQNNETFSELIILKQKKREIQIAKNILSLLNYYSKNTDGSAEYYTTVKSNLNTNPFSNTLLNIIGILYIEIGKDYLSWSSSVINGLKSSKRSMQYKYNILSGILKQEKRQGINIIINTVLIDIEKTIKSAARKIFIDSTIDKSQKMLYAKGLVFIGNIFVEGSNSLSQTKEFLEMVF